MTLAGFVITAMAVVSATKDSTPKVVDYENADSGRGYLFNSPAFKALVKAYTDACLIFGFAFLFFSSLRTVSESIDIRYLFNLTFFGVFVTFFTVARCIYLIQSVMKIQP